MIKEMKRSMIRELDASFSFPVYAEVLPQASKRPCFFVKLKSMEDKQLLGRRKERRVTFSIEYLLAQGLDAREKAAEVADMLYEKLYLIGEDEKFIACGLEHELIENGIMFLATYKYHVILEDNTELMGRLEHNGERVVGYEEENEIQQGAMDEEQEQ